MSVHHSFWNLSGRPPAWVWYGPLCFPLVITCCAFQLLSIGTDCIWVTVIFPMHSKVSRADRCPADGRQPGMRERPSSHHLLPQRVAVRPHTLENDGQFVNSGSSEFHPAAYSRGGPRGFVWNHCHLGVDKGHRPPCSLNAKRVGEVGMKPPVSAPSREIMKA